MSFQIANRIKHLLPTTPPQPRPVGLIVCRFRGGTAITRVWANGDERDCRLCGPACATAGGSCLVVIGGHVRAEDAALVRLDGSVAPRNVE